MMKRIAILLLVFVAVVGIAEAQRPPLIMTIWGKGANTVLETGGRWPTSTNKEPALSTNIQCFKAAMTCVESNAVPLGPQQAQVQTWDYDIRKWNSREVVADDDDNADQPGVCEVHSLRIDFIQKTATIASITTNSPDPSCKGKPVDAPASLE